MPASSLSVRNLCLAIILAIIFTISGLYLMVSITLMLNDLLDEYIKDPWACIGTDYTYQTYDSIVAFLAPLGYLCFLLTIVFILLGLIVKRYQISVFGSYVLYLPLFGSFSFTMTVLFAGLGVIRILWLPFFDFAPDLLNAALIILFPLYLHHIVLFLGIFGTLLLLPLMVVLIFLGLFIFVFGVITWLYGKFQGRTIIDFWIYRYSRHPQYLGLILFNYGLIIIPMLFPFGGPHPPLPTLPWLLLTLIIIGMAITEENNFLKEANLEFTNWRKRTPFMIPLPKVILSFILWPLRILLKKEWPETNREIILILLVYGVILVLLSFPLLPLEPGIGVAG
ncbi:MAG: hypothetical protein ACFFC6_00615 [Promethearchaeota archaeon]